MEIGEAVVAVRLIADFLAEELQTTGDTKEIGTKMKGWQTSDIERLKSRGMVRETVPQGTTPHQVDDQLFKKIFLKKLKNALNPSEEDIQKSCFTWFRFEHPGYRLRCYHIPNGGQRNKIVAAKLKGQGTLPGAWDIFLSVPRGGFSGFYIEIKTLKNPLTENQLKFMEANQLDYLFKVCRSLEDFKNEIDKYLKL